MKFIVIVILKYTERITKGSNVSKHVKYIQNGIIKNIIQIDFLMGCKEGSFN